MKLKAGEVTQIARTVTEEAMIQLEDVIAKHPLRFGASTLADDAAEAIEERLRFEFKKAIEAIEL